VSEDGGHAPGDDGQRRRPGAEHDPEPPRPARATDGGRERAGRSTRVTIARREVASLRSEKTILLALSIQLVVAAFSSFLVVGLVSLYSPSGSGVQPTVGVTGNASGAVLEAAAEAESDVDVLEYPESDAAAQGLRNGAIDATVRADRLPSGQVRVRATVPEGDVQTTVTVVAVRDVLETLERDLRDDYAREGRLPDPLPVPERVPASPYFGFTYTVLVPLLMFLPAFISGSIAVDSLTEEVQRGTLELLRVAPVDLSTIVDAKVLSAATLAPVQVALWIALLRVNGTGVANPLGLLGVVAGLSTALVVAGAGIALTTPDRRQAQFLYSVGVLAAAVVAGLLPEHPANTVAKLAVGSPTATTWVAVAGYVALGVVAYVAVRVGVARVDPERL